MKLDTLRRQYERKERALWVRTLRQTCGNVSQTAKALGVTTQYGFERVASLKLKPEVAKARKACAIPRRRPR